MFITIVKDWILDRRHCPRDWIKNVYPIRNRINLAIQDMPEHEAITALLTGSAIHYFNCLEIVKILSETEKSSKNIFGSYSSQRMKDWNSIVNLYQKNSIYLAEAASILQRNVAYEIPGIKKQILKCHQQQTASFFRLYVLFCRSSFYFLLIVFERNGKKSTHL